MARTIHKLTDRQIRAATKPMGDGGGLWLYPQGGARRWSFRYTIAGVAREMAENAEARVVGAGDVGSDFMILDIGPETIRRYAGAIEGTGTLVWNGPMGAAELERFRQGTHSLAARIAELSSRGDLSSVAGGGDTVAFLGQHGFLHVFTYASMAGGAFLQWLSGEPLPGVEALGKVR